MPVIHVHMLGGASHEQKAQIAKEFTDTLVRVLGSNPQMTHIILDEQNPENWANAGELISDRRAKQKA
ncbi:uncharacterized protein, 4-oxalocrotonate tautomerase [Terriglobus roseus DSM 18391]|uniref:Uncharacterized protein, 4-oxalocrotonate tautomerase n=1 Tax=Terriglobus roseus (strain DSM 18391 / NRRL B-41598 / KBS 63) TaxID=926566 RepID=I3ZBD1_TERRK|nr:4-oxalocrotonate tautomerase family protein [Terriglobus roseus]AFL86549.1 uncharacterized protein, 4-oxalocrotonate tautomerase [Terriglobus roseus DSM 18391]